MTFITGMNGAWRYDSTAQIAANQTYFVTFVATINGTPWTWIEAVKNQ